MDFGGAGPQRSPKRIPTLPLIPPSGCRGLDIGVGGPEVTKAHSDIDIVPSGCNESGYLPVHRDIFYLLARFVWKSSNR